MKSVSLTLNATGDARPLIEAIRADNPNATILNMPSVVKIDCADRIVINAATVSDRIGRPWDTQELHMTMISISGYIDQDDDRVELSWNRARKGDQS